VIRPAMPRYGWAGRCSICGSVIAVGTREHRETHRAASAGGYSSM
jgi:hypothetical protein